MRSSRCLAALAILAALSPAAALEINSASRAELERLQGLGVATTERILRAREQAPFADWGDLAARVAGLRGRRAEALHRQGLTVNGKPLPSGEGKGR